MHAMKARDGMMTEASATDALALAEGAGIVLVTAVGLIHFVQVGEYFGYAAWLGFAFLANTIGALVAAALIGWGGRFQRWGWLLGLLVTTGALVGYLVSRTAGLPGLPEDDSMWSSQLGILSLIAEIPFIVLAGAVLTGRVGRAGQHESALRSAA
jgi:hypothetical protein